MTASPAATTHLKGTAIAALGVLILSPDTLLLRLIEADTETIAFWRYLLMGINMLMLYAVSEGAGWFGKLRRFGWPGLATAGLFSINQICFVFAVANTGVANVVLIVAAAPLFAAVFSWIFLREATAPRTWLAILAVVAGMALIFAGEAGLLSAGETGAVGPRPMLGNVLALVVALSLSAGFTLVRHRREVNSLPAMTIASFVSAFAMVWVATPFAMDSTSFGWQVLMGLIVTYAFALITTAPRFAPAAVVGLMLLLEGVLGPLIVWAVLGEVPSRWALLGGGVVLVALLLHGFGEVLAWRRARRSKPLNAREGSANSQVVYETGS
jgi:drug/metabolite transporter (DMT)-like permease